MKASVISWIDRAGACVSLGCAAHCLAMPFALVFIPMAGLGFLAGAAFEWFMVASAGVLGIWTAFCAMRRRRGKLILVFVGAGLALLISAREPWAGWDAACCELHALAEGGGLGWRSILAVAGGTLVAAAHLLNLRQGRLRNVIERPPGGPGETPRASETPAEGFR